MTLKQTLLLALSGPSSSGKTTLARLLHRTIFPPSNTLLLHLDDFYLPESQLPQRAGLVDWDSAGALDLVALERTLQYIRTHGSLPPTFVSKEDSNDVGAVPVPAEMISALAGEVREWWREGGVGEHIAQIVIVDGFLLLGQSIPQVREAFDVKVLLRAGFAEAKRRREARSGYVTLEGWWQDPPGYVDKVVWPAFVEEHAYLFTGGDVEGDVDGDVVAKLGIEVAPKGDLTDTLGWVVEVVKKGVEKRIDRGADV